MFNLFHQSDGVNMDSFIGPPRTPASGRAQRILVVEDNADSARRLRSIIHLWGHDTRIAYDGIEAIDLAREYQPDVVLLDISLPGMDGYAVARVLREAPELHHAKILAMTGHGFEEDQRKAIEAGFDRHLLKPLELDLLEVLLSELADTLR